MSDNRSALEQLPPDWTLTAREDAEQSWVVLTGPSGQACAFSAERGSVRAQVLQDFMIARIAPAPEAPPSSKPMNGIEQIDADTNEARFASECNKRMIHLNLPPMDSILTDAYQLGYLHGLGAERKRAKQVETSGELVERSVFDAELKALGERMAADGHIVIQRLLYEAEVVGRDKCRFDNWPKHLREEAYDKLGLDPVEMFRRRSEKSNEQPSAPASPPLSKSASSTDEAGVDLTISRPPQ